MSESAEAIAKVVHDLQIRNVRLLPHAEDEEEDITVLNNDTAALVKRATVVDATAVWSQWMAGDGGRAVYEDHRICPPWLNAIIGYVNSYGNVNVMSTRTVDLTSDDEKVKAIEYWESLADDHTIDWDRVRWVTHVVIYVGGRSRGQPLATVGPMHCWRIAIHADGEIADINWIQLRKDLKVEMWDTAMMVLLDTLNLCNCVNVELMEPKRSRPAQRRIERTGIRVSELHVRPISKSYRGNRNPVPLGLLPIHSVRGHFAEYGTNGRGLLFGKIAGRFWIPSHARGNPDRGEVEQSYVVDVAKDSEYLIE